MKKAFTLMEVIISVTSFFLLMTLVINSYLGVVSFRNSFQVRAKLLESTYYMFEKVNLILRDYTIDYEEYFNRSKVGCDSLGDISWNVGLNGYCDQYTTFGNSNVFSTLTGNHSLYYCSSLSYDKSYERVVPSLPPYLGCPLSGYQSFGQYKVQFTDVKENADFSPSLVNDADDTDLGKGPESILNATGVQELYLISKDKQYRVFLRRVLIESGDRNGDNIVSGDNEFLYGLQMLKLRSFDAGSSHDFDTNISSGVYDGIIDTWACDYSQGFICSGTPIGNVYSGYKIPLDDITGWVDLFDRSITVVDWNIDIYPTKDPFLAWGEEEYQINPYFTISLKTKPYAGLWRKKLQGSVVDYQFTLQTTFTTKNNY